MKSAISFIDKALDDAVRKSAHKLSKFQTELDATSADLKNLEKYLQSCSICIPIYVPTKEPFSVGWENNGGNWRLVASTPVSDDEEDGYESRPIIELPIRMRLLCRSYLPALVKALADLIPEGPEEDLDLIFASDEDKKTGEEIYGSASDDEAPF